GAVGYDRGTGPRQTALGQCEPAIHQFGCGDGVCEPELPSGLGTEGRLMTSRGAQPMTIQRMTRIVALTCFLAVTGVTARAQGGAEALLGNWAFTSPGGGACWLGLGSEEVKLSGSLLWEGGRPVPVANAYVEDSTLHFIRIDGRYVYVSYPVLDRVKAWP